MAVNVEKGNDAEANAGESFIPKTENTQNTQNDKKATAKGTFHQILLTLGISTMMISMAQSLAFPAVFLPQVTNVNQTIYMDIDTGSWYNSVNSLSSPIGSIIIGIIMDRFGRRVALATPLLPLIISHLTTALSQSNLVLFVSRVTIGLCAGCIAPTCQIYIAECADSKLRSMLMNFGYISLSIGFLLTFTFGALFDWRTLTYTFMVLPSLALIGLCFLPETPVWLLRHDQKTKACKTLEWLRGNEELARNELNENVVRIEQEKSSATANDVQKTSNWHQFKRSSILKPLFIIVMFIILLNISGTYLIVYYALDIISQVGLEASKSSLSIYLSLIRLIVTIAFCFIFMRVQRRRFFLFAGIGSTLSTILLALFLQQRTAIDIAQQYDKCIVGSLLITYVSTNTGFMIAPGFLIGELLPARVRGQLAGYIYTFFGVATFVVVKVFPSLRAEVGIVGILYVFSLASLLTVALVYFMVPETKGKSLVEIERYFQNSGWIYRPNDVGQHIRNRL